MRDEILKYRGMLAELERKNAELDVIISADISNARNLLNPFEDDTAKLDTAQTVAVVNRIHDNAELMRANKKRIAEIREMLT